MSGGCTNATLKPGDQCTITISFAGSSSYVSYISHYSVNFTNSVGLVMTSLDLSVSGEGGSGTVFGHP